MKPPVHPLAGFDFEISERGRKVLAGVDEAGRGCWAGPVVAAAVVLPSGWCPAGLDDSKKLTAARREELYLEIRAGALGWGACAVSAAEIDRLNILEATLVAMARAVGRLAPTVDLVLVDGNQSPEISPPVRTLVRGDSRSAAVAAASVVAKVLRDRVMRGWDRHHPGYGFASHKGYGVPVHRDALRKLGPCSIHRFTYRPVALRGQRQLY